MRYLLFLSGENLELAKEEAISLSGCKIVEQEGGCLVIEAEPFEFNRLAFTHHACRFVFKCKNEELLEKAKGIDWQEYVNGSFFVYLHKFNENAAEIADGIWAKLDKPSVDAKNAKTKVDFFLAGKSIFCGIRLWENKEDFESRKAHKRPGFSPVSLHPKLARALVNLSRAKSEETVLDPFCGTGGILLEAGLMGLKTIGNDIDKKMLAMAKTNLDFFKVKGYRLMQKDARKIKVETDAIVTDPPYGRASSLKKQDMREMIEGFLDNAYNLLQKGKRLIIIFPNSMKFKSKFKTEKAIDVYVHKLLTRTVNIMLKQA